MAVVHDVNRSLVVLFIFWVMVSVARPAFLLLGRDSEAGKALIGWAVRLTLVLLVFLGLAVILEIWGIRVWPILAGFGIVGIAVALGAKDLFKDLIAGVFVLGELRCQTHDVIEVDGIVDGTVEAIGLRTTTVRRFDSGLTFVPNSKLADHALTNFSRRKFRRILWVVGVEYSATIPQLRQIRDGIERFILGNADFAQPQDATASVRIAALGESSIDIEVYCFTASTDWDEWMKVKESLAFAVMEVLARAGVGLAYPSRSVYLETLPQDAELFTGVEAVRKSAGRARRATKT